MLKAKIKEKLLNRRNEIDVDEIRDSNGNLIDLEALINNPEIKEGYYIKNEENNFVWVETIPEDYLGYYYQIELYNTDVVTIGFIDNGVVQSFISMNMGTISVLVQDGTERAELRTSGVTKLDFARLTHSLNELDSTLKALCETAISSRTEQPCTQAQWNAIKTLLDKSLYFYYNDYTMIKIGGLYPNLYSFSCININSGYSLEFEYNSDEELLTIYSNEI